MERNTLKKCRLCGEEKTLDCFYRSSARTRDGLQHECKVCHNSNSLKHYYKNKEKRVVQRRDYHYRRNYGISFNDFSQMSDNVGNKCEVCEETPVVLDHCHTTGKVRGVLCNKCNQALGLMRDNEQFILGLVEYLKRTSK